MGANIDYSFFTDLKFFWAALRPGLHPSLKAAPLLVVLLFALPVFVFSQNKAAEKANELFKMEQYAPAASEYEMAIKELKAKGKSARHLLNLQTKLAYCYRMNNRMEDAEALYAEVVKNDRAKSEAYFFYGETLMANEKYEEAKRWFADYQKLEPDDEKAPLMVKACDEVRFIEPYFQHVDIQEFVHNSEADDNAAVAWDGGIVFSSDRKSGVKLMKEKSGWTGREYLNIYFSKKEEDGEYGAPKQFSGKLSELNKNTGNTSFSFDGKEVFFTRNDNVLNKQKAYNLQLFRAERDDDRWRNVEKLPFCSENYNYMHPAISPDGKLLFFVSDRGGGQGGTDIWVSVREDGKWGRPENLGPTVNTSANEGFPFMDAQGRLYFCSKGHVGYGGFDIFYTEMTGAGLWKKPANMGKPINSALDDISIYVDEGRRSGMFSSARNGGDDDIFFFEVLENPPLEMSQPDEKTAGEVMPTLEEIEVEKNTSELEEEAETESLAIAEIEEEMPAPPQNDMPETEVAEAQHEEILPSANPPAEIENTAVDTTDEMAQSLDNEGLVANDTAVASFLEELENQPSPPSGTFEYSEEISPIEALGGNEREPVEMGTDGEVLLFSFADFLEKAAKNELETDQRFRIDNAVFDPQIWQLTPPISRSLDDLVGVLRRFPSLEIELRAHTEALGLSAHNFQVSQHRANTMIEYLVREGIAPERLKATGLGEAELLNHCQDGVVCSPEEHRFNQRVEIKVLSLGQGQ